MKNSQKGFVVPLLVAIIAILIIGGGVYIYENKKVETPVVADNTTQQSNQIKQINTQNTPVIKTTPVSNPAPVKSSITISSPNGQEVWVNGSEQTIRWTSKGSDATQPVEIVLERRSPTDTQFWNIGTIVTNQPGSGSYTWVVSPKDVVGNIIANSQYKILIGRNLAKGTGPVDESDNYFLIASPSNSPVIQQNEKIQAYINVVDKNGQPFRAARVWWYYPPVNGARATEYHATCVNNTCTRWSVTGAIGPRVYTAAEYKIEPAPGALCFAQAYDAKPIELSSSVAEVTLTLELGSYCY
jgi:Ser-Thr-rich glycosyl-phosphatidyl-inositol-anchored membrane family